jgi:hypothetical protein
VPNTPGLRKTRARSAVWGLFLSMCVLWVWTVSVNTKGPVASEDDCQSCDKVFMAGLRCCLTTEAPNNVTIDALAEIEREAFHTMPTLRPSVQAGEPARDHQGARSQRSSAARQDAVSAVGDRELEFPVSNPQQYPSRACRNVHGYCSPFRRARRQTVRQCGDEPQRSPPPSARQVRSLPVGATCIPTSRTQPPQPALRRR